MHECLSMLQIQICIVWTCRNIVQVAFFFIFCLLKCYVCLQLEKKNLCEESEYKIHARQTWL